MKNLTYRFSGLMLVAVVLLFTACGGGDDESSDNKMTSADLNNETIDRMGSNIAKTIPGCVYTSNESGVVLSDNDNLLVAVEPVSNVANRVRRSIRANEKTYTLKGPCGGTAAVSQLHLKGSDDVKVTLTNYCMKNGETGDTLTMNGALKAYVAGKPSPDGPVREKATMSTGSSGISVKGRLNGVDTNYVAYLDDVSATLNDKKFNKITADEIKVVNNGNIFKVTDLDGTLYQGGDANNGYVEIKSATYHDPKEGTMKISTSKIPLSKDATGPATITATSKGESVKFTSDDLSSGIFRSEAGGLDCSGLLR